MNDNMVFIHRLGPLALGSRLKNLSDRLMKEMSTIYRQLGVEFEPRWFTIFQVVLQQDEIAVTEIADVLGLTHPAVVQVVNILERKGLVAARQDPEDRRRRLVTLTEEGRCLVNQLEPLWEDVRQATTELLSETDPSLLSALDSLEKALERKSSYRRIRERTSQRLEGDLELVDFTAEHTTAFRNINCEWLEEELEITLHDRQLLDHPRSEILDRGGRIFMLLLQGTPIGTCVLMPLAEGIAELSKYAILHSQRGLGLGGLLLRRVVAEASSMGYSEILLLSHPLLKRATRLYRGFGFRELPSHPLLPDPTGRQSITMQLMLNDREKS